MSSAKKSPKAQKSPKMQKSPKATKASKPGLTEFDYSLTEDDLFLVGNAEIEEKGGFISHQLNSANNLYEKGISQIITQVHTTEVMIANERDLTDEDKSIKQIYASVKFHDVKINRPTYTYNSQVQPLYPLMALLGEKTYSADISVQATIKAIAYLQDGGTIEREQHIDTFNLCKIPIMVKSKWCNLYKRTAEEMINLNEDPSDPGGYFIIKGVEWSIDNVENILFNQIHITKSTLGKESYRCEFISKPGDNYQNSDQIQILWLNDNQLTVEIRRSELKSKKLPFYVLFRALGWSTDKEIFDNILMNDKDDAITKNMLVYLKNAFDAKYSNAKDPKNRTIASARYEYERSKILRMIVEEINYEPSKRILLDSEEKYQIRIDKLIKSLDTFFLPHIGKTADVRHEKLRFLALMIRKMFLTDMGLLQVIDRDSYKHKRIHATGTNFAKAFKPLYNSAIIRRIYTQLYKKFKNNPFSKVDLESIVLSDIKSNNFDKAIMQVITSGDKADIAITAQKKIVNRLTSQQVDRKNQLATYSILRQVSVKNTGSSKQSARANEMRRIHPSYIGYICLLHSPEGAKVGLNKQMTLFSSICEASSSESIKNILLGDTDLTPLNQIDASDLTYYYNVYVNGHWIGCVRDGLTFAIKYKSKRRIGEIPTLTTIYWDNMENEVYFWTDVGRITRPLLIVWNNKRDSDEIITAKTDKFYQGIKLTKKHTEGLLNKTINMQDLIENRMVEYISAEEQENCLICPTFEQLAENKNNELQEYTHCEIPCSLLGLTALTCPYGNRNATIRITYQINQVKKTGGQPALNSLDRCDKNVFYQYYNEMPLVKTVTNDYLFPNGMNVIVAIMCNTGFGQDDSIIISKGAIDRGLFNGCKLTFEKSELEPKGESFGRPKINPDGSNQTNIIRGNYSKIDENGMINVGQRIYKNDIIVGKQYKQSKLNEEEQYIDTSTIYKSDEPAIVHNVIQETNDAGIRFCKVAMRKPRSIIIGDKFSSRSGQFGSSELATAC